MRNAVSVALCALICGAALAKDKPKKQPPESALDQTIEQIAATQSIERQAAQPGSLWTPTA